MKSRRIKCKKEPDWLGIFMREVVNVFSTMPEVGVWRLEVLRRIIENRSQCVEAEIVVKRKRK